MIQSGPFWWTGHYIKDDQTPESFLREFFGNNYDRWAGYSSPDAFEGMREEFDHPGQAEFVHRVLKLLDAVCLEKADAETISLLFKAVSKHLQADAILAAEFHSRVRSFQEEHGGSGSEYDRVKSLKPLKDQLLEQVGAGFLSFAQADKRLRAAKKKAGIVDRESVGTAVWQDLATSEARTRLLTEADSYEQQAGAN